MMRFCLWAGTCVFALLSIPAWADVWGYLDDKGTPHFAADKVDERYELFFRSNAKPQPGEVTGSSQIEDYPRPVALPKLAPKLLAFFEVSPSYKGVRPLMKEAANTYNIDVELLQAVIATESGFDAQVMSPKGAVGLMQIMPATAERYGVTADALVPLAKKLTDPQTNIKTGSRYLRYLINLFPGRLELALAAYNAGEGAVQRAGNKVPNYKETQDYVKTVMQLYAVLKPPTAVADSRKALPGQPVPTVAQPNSQGDVPGAPRGAVLVGGAKGRGNMIAPLLALDTPSARSAALNFEP